MRRLSPLALVLLTGCGATLNMPTPIAYPGACPPEDHKCQRNADAQTLMYIGEEQAALRLMCDDLRVREAVGSRCSDSHMQHSVFPALY